MFKHILVAIDASEYSASAVPTAIELAKSFNADVFVLHVREHALGRAAVYPQETQDEATQLVAAAVKVVKDAGIAVKGEVHGGYVGRTAQGIVETAKAHEVDLIVMGSRGLSDIAGAFLGSVTHKVMQIAETPVLVDRTPVKVGLKA
jgi:nucleotide-binding universal stress UspA family protein